MAYTKGFENDIFISYSHVDNATVDNSEGWVDMFVKKLNVALSQCVGIANTVKIWHDEKLRKNDLFDSVIENHIQSSGIFVAILSNGYKKSEYCQKELHCFCQFAESSPLGLLVDYKSRVLCVLIKDIDYHHLHEIFNRMLPYQFHNEKGFTISYQKDEFDDQIRELAKDIHSMTDAIVKATKTSSPDIQQKPNKFPVLFADVPKTLLDDRELLISNLANYDVEVLLPPPITEKEYNKKFIDIAKKARLIIHLLDQFPSEKVGNSSKTYDQKQLKLCLKVDTPKFIWVPRDLQFENITDPIHKEFLIDIEKNQSFIRGNRTELINEILDYINRLKKKVRNTETQIVKNRILLSVHRKDSDDADDLINLMGMNDCITLINKISDNPMEKIIDFDNQLRETGTLIIIYNHVNKDWVIRRLELAVQSIALNEYPKKNLFIYMPNKAEESFRLPWLLIDKVKKVAQKEDLLKYIKCGGIK